MKNFKKGTLVSGRLAEDEVDFLWLKYTYKYGSSQNISSNKLGV